MKLFVGLPTTHGSMQSRFLEGMMSLFRDRAFDMVVAQFIDPYIVSARNAAATDFLQTDCTHLLFIDADILFRSEQVTQLLSHDEDIVGGLYPKKDDKKMQWVCNALPSRPPVDSRGLVSLKHIGTGFLLIKRGVFEKMIEVFGDEISYMEDEIDRQRWAFFLMPIVKNRLLSEDWYFCERAKEIGFEIYGDTRVLLRHIGSAVYPLEHQVIESRRRELRVVKHTAAG